MRAIRIALLGTALAAGSAVAAATSYRSSLPAVSRPGRPAAEVRCPLRLSDASSPEPRAMPPAAAANAARLTLGGVTVLQFRAAAGGFSPEERRSHLQSRVIEILSHPELRPDDVHVLPGPGGHSATVMVGSLLFVTATEADARANQSTPEQLAQTWAENFRRAFAAARPRPNPPRK